MDINEATDIINNSEFDENLTLGKPISDKLIEDAFWYYGRGIMPDKRTRPLMHAMVTALRDY